VAKLNNRVAVISGLSRPDGKYLHGRADRQHQLA
jgi:hypothetical protein